MTSLSGKVADDPTLRLMSARMLHPKRHGRHRMTSELTRSEDRVAGCERVWDFDRSLAPRSTPALPEPNQAVETGAQRTAEDGGRIA
jgi:hypothetical protein